MTEPTNYFDKVDRHAEESLRFHGGDPQVAGLVRGYRELRALMRGVHAENETLKKAAKDPSGGFGLEGYPTADLLAEITKRVRA